MAIPALVAVALIVLFSLASAARQEPGFAAYPSAQTAQGTKKTSMMMLVISALVAFTLAAIFDDEAGEVKGYVDGLQDAGTQNEDEELVTTNVPVELDRNLELQGEEERHTERLTIMVVQPAPAVGPGTGEVGSHDVAPELGQKIAIGGAAISGTMIGVNIIIIYTKHGISLIIKVLVGASVLSTLAAFFSSLALLIYMVFHPREDPNQSTRKIKIITGSMMATLALGFIFLVALFIARAGS